MQNKTGHRTEEHSLEKNVMLQLLVEEVNSIKATLDEAKEAGQTLNEAQTEFIIIDPLLKRMGYSPLEILKRNHDGVTNNFPDYTVLGGRPQKWFLEAKRLDLNLQDGEAAQAVNYANNQGAEWAVLTNGRKWYIYNAHLPKPLPEKRVLQIEDLFNDEQAIQILWLLSKPSILNNDLQEAWLFQQLTGLFDEQMKTPHSDLRELIRKLGTEATKFAVSDETVGKVLLFATPAAIALTAGPVQTSTVDDARADVADAQKMGQEQPVGTGNKFYTLDEIARDITLATFRKPKAICLDHTTEDVKTWADVARLVVAYVATVSVLPPLPYNAGSKGKNHFLNSTATHSSDKKMQSHRSVVVGSETVFIDTNRSTLNICAALMAFMRATGVPFSAVQISIE